MLTFTLPDGTTESVEVTALLNAGYAGRNQEEVASHIAELAELGVPAPTVTPALYPISPYLAQQTDAVAVQHGRTSGEAEWALVILGDTIDDVLLTVACDTPTVTWKFTASRGARTRLPTCSAPVRGG